MFNRLAEQTGREVTWNYDDIYNHFKVSTEDRKLDASRFADWLKEMDLHGLPAFLELNEYGQLKCAAFTVPGAIEWWALNQDSVSVHYDTTFGTNRSGMKLGLVTVVNGDGYTRILFITLVAYQNQESFAWVFRKLIEVFRIHPKVIFTDSDPALATSISLVLMGTTHLLCTWHLSLNLATNVKSVAGPRWNDVNGKFWQVIFIFLSFIFHILAQTSMLKSHMEECPHSRPYLSTHVQYYDVSTYFYTQLGAQKTSHVVNYLRSYYMTSVSHGAFATCLIHLRFARSLT